MVNDLLTLVLPPHPKPVPFRKPRINNHRRFKIDDVSIVLYVVSGERCLFPLISLGPVIIPLSIIRFCRADYGTG